MIKGCLGPLPLFKEREEGEAAEEEAPASLPIPIQLAAARPAVLADGSYATQTALPGGEAAAAGGAAAAAAANVPNLRWVARRCAGRGLGSAGRRAPRLLLLCRACSPPASAALNHALHCLPRCGCRALLLSGDFFVGAVIAATLTKLVRRAAGGGGGGWWLLGGVAGAEDGRGGGRQGWVGWQQQQRQPLVGGPH